MGKGVGRLLKKTNLYRDQQPIAELPAGSLLPLLAWNTNGSTVRLTLDNVAIAGFNTVEVNTAHLQITEGASVGIPSEKRLAVPYLSQRDNRQNPSGSCNVTSVAMCLKFLKVPQKTAEPQFEDELYNYALAKGYSRHSPHDLVEIIRDYGAKDTFTDKATENQLKAHIASGNPAIIHGYFTRFGHIIVVCGYNERGWIVHDPWGEWYEWGYDTDASGAALVYSYAMIRRLCCPDGDFWVHQVSK